MGRWHKFQLLDGGDGRVEVRSPYNVNANYAFKDLAPYYKCAWIPGKGIRMAWPHLVPGLQDIAEIYYGEKVNPPIMRSAPLRDQEDEIELHYIGTAKHHYSSYVSDESHWHSGMLPNGQYRVIFPHEVLKDWVDPFGDSGDDILSIKDPYKVLGVERDADHSEIKSAFRSLSRSWHPDLNQGEPKAHEMQQKINWAWSLLGTTDERAKWDAVSMLAGSAKRTGTGLDSMLFATAPAKENDWWSPPRRNGIIRATFDQWGEFRVIKSIKSWDMIKNERGQIMVSAWDKIRDEVKIEWI
jgi:hypothetical protein